MKTWGLSRWGPLLAVLTLLVSAGVLVPLNAQAAGKTVFGFVTDCANLDSVGATVSLVDAQAQLPTVNTTSSSTIGYYSFSNPTPAYYKVRVQPVGFTYFTGESAVFRFDGTASKRVDVCVVKMSDRNRWVNLTVIDAQPAAVSGESVNFQEFARGPENATEAGHLRYNQGTFVSVTLNGVKSYINKTYNQIPSGVSELNVAFQMDGNYAQQAFDVWLDKVSLNYW